MVLFALVAAFGLFTSAKPVPAQDNGEAAKTIKFLLSGQDYVYTARRDGGVISLDSKSEKGDLTLNPTWLVPSNVGFLISDANSGAMIDTTYNKQSNNLTVSGHYYQGSVGVGHMTYNKNSTRLLASTSVGVDIWDSSASNGSLELLGSFSSDDNSTGSYITQVVPDPSGKIYVVSDRTANSLIILSAIDDNDIKPLGTIAIQESCGPRRGAFYAADGQNPTRYFALCQSTKELLSLEVDLSKGTFKLLQRLQTSVDTNGDKRSVADLLLQTNSDRSADLYVTNTFVSKDNDTDTIAHFRLPAPDDDESTAPGDLTDITAERIVPSGGVNPNSICLDPEGEYLIVGNQQKGPAAIAFLKRDTKTGALSEKPEATLDFKKLTKGTTGFGPSFVAPILK
ncbi:hypothetical protein SLS64_000103 [Diaporthe eres]